MGFYRLHMLEVITVEFLIVPLVLVLGGVTMLLTSLFGFYVTMKENSCLMITYAIMLTLNFLFLMTGIVSSIRLLFDIQTGLLDADVIPELTLYETDPWVMYKWDTIQREFTCCGGYSYINGYMDWKHTLLGGAHNSVPDSCCLIETPQCGANIFAITDLRVVIAKIHTHGCLTIMLRRLDTHVKVRQFVFQLSATTKTLLRGTKKQALIVFFVLQIILVVFSVVGGLIAILELLTVVLACCFANQISKVERDEGWDYEPNGSLGMAPLHHSANSRRPSYASQHETAF